MISISFIVLAVQGIIAWTGLANRSPRFVLPKELRYATL